LASEREHEWRPDGATSAVATGTERPGVAHELAGRIGADLAELSRVALADDAARADRLAVLARRHADLAVRQHAALLVAGHAAVVDGVGARRQIRGGTRTTKSKEAHHETDRSHLHATVIEQSPGHCPTPRNCVAQCAKTPCATCATAAWAVSPSCGRA